MKFRVEGMRMKDLEMIASNMDLAIERKVKVVAMA